ncbi:hypothetical protein FQA39_LY15306 [Lamprigera yunnana]|nr:hypothetical protein FQA39_LY15306 [Lamprigera yunnana]
MVSFKLKSVWQVLEILVMVYSLYLMWEKCIDILKNPLVVTLENNYYPIEKISFPAVAICSMNVISKKRIENYAAIISKKLNLPYQSVLSDVKLLTNLYDYSITNSNSFGRAQSLIEKYEYLYNNKSKNIYAIMKNLSIPCEELLVDCIWRRLTYNCSNLFQLRSTPIGFCCAFNYRTQSRYAKKLKFRYKMGLKHVGSNNGLIVTVTNNLSDYFYTTLPSVGITVQVFAPTDYPDSTSGNFLQKVIPIGSESFLELLPSKINTVQNIRKYAYSLRNCIFDDEEKTVFGDYSYSNCLVECRIQSILTLCECIPFIMPFKKNATCFLSNIPCLNKYQDKWKNLFPSDFNGDELDREKENSLMCANCYPDCTTTTYTVKMSSVQLSEQSIFLGNHNTDNVLKVFYGKGFGQLYKQDIVYYWFETLSSLGGILGFFLGFSLISIVELLYLVVPKVFTILKQKFLY